MLTRNQKLKSSPLLVLMCLKEIKYAEEFVPIGINMFQEQGARGYE